MYTHEKKVYLIGQFWRSVTDLMGKIKRTSNIIDDNDVSECFAHSYENVFNQVGLNVLT